MTNARKKPVLFITGTDTDVGKTVATAVLAAALGRERGPAGSGGSVAIDKPTQTGVGAGDGGDIGEVRRLAAIDAGSEGVRLVAPMAPVDAARREGAVLPTMADHRSRIRRLSNQYDRVLVEGAGGLLVHIDARGNTIADLAAEFGERAAMILVCRSTLGTLNHTELTLEALRRRGLRVAGLVIGSWPDQPDAIDIGNRRYLEGLDVTCLGAIPERASSLDPGDFRLRAGGWIARPD